MFSSTSCASSLRLQIETQRFVDALSGLRIPSQSSGSRKIPQTSLHCGLPVCNLHSHADFTCKCSSIDPPTSPNPETTASASLNLVYKENRDAKSHPAECTDQFLKDGNEDGDEISQDSHSLEFGNRQILRVTDKTQRFPVDRSALWRTPAIEPKVLTPLEQETMEFIMNLKIIKKISQGCLMIRVVRPEQLSDLENLLADSYSELMWGPLTYRPALLWILEAYLRERQAYLPDAVTLVAFYAPNGSVTNNAAQQQRWILAGAVEVSFNAAGKPTNMQTPLPPIDAPFLSNMAVIKKLRRMGIGKELLRAAEDLAVQMGCAEMYLHCRMIDEVPLNMYMKSGYKIIDTDNILSLLTFQRRRHLLKKDLTTDKDVDERA